MSDHGWTIIRGGLEKITIASPGLTYADYGLSDIGNAALISTITSGLPGEGVMKSFAEQTSGTVYVGFMIHVTDASTTTEGGLVLYLGSTGVGYTSLTFGCRIRKDASDNVAFGVEQRAGISYTGYDYSLNTTYFIVMAYEFITDAPDMISIWINPPVEGPPTAPDDSNDAYSDAASLAEIVLTRISADRAPMAKIDGIRVTTEWDFQTPSNVRLDPLVMPRKPLLFQNYPNPFNPETTIRFHLPQMSEVTLTVYDVLGRRVRTLTQGEWSSGSHEIIWDGRDQYGSVVATGVYFYRIRMTPLAPGSESIQMVKKMLYLR